MLLRDGFEWMFFVVGIQRFFCEVMYSLQNSKPCHTQGRFFGIPWTVWVGRSPLVSPSLDEWVRLHQGISNWTFICRRGSTQFIVHWLIFFCKFFTSCYGLMQIYCSSFSIVTFPWLELPNRTTENNLQVPQKIHTSKHHFWPFTKKKPPRKASRYSLHDFTDQLFWHIICNCSIDM